MGYDNSRHGFLNTLYKNSSDRTLLNTLYKEYFGPLRSVFWGGSWKGFFEVRREKEGEGGWEGGCGGRALLWTRILEAGWWWG